MPKSRKKDLSYKCANYPCRSYPLTSAREMHQILCLATFSQRAMHCLAHSTVPLALTSQRDSVRGCVRSVTQSRVSRPHLYHDQWFRSSSLSWSRRHSNRRTMNMNGQAFPLESLSTCRECTELRISEDLLQVERVGSSLMRRPAQSTSDKLFSGFSFLEFGRYEVLSLKPRRLLGSPHGKS